MSALFGTTYGFVLLSGLSFATVYAMHYYQQCAFCSSAAMRVSTDRVVFCQHDACKEMIKRKSLSQTKRNS